MAKLAETGTHHDRILRAALSLLTKQGRDAVTTRSVAEAAKVQPPVLYRIFGDKEGLLKAVAAYGFRAYLAKKQPPEPKSDPVEVLRAGWNLHTEFGLENPELYLLMYAMPRPEAESPAAQQAFAVLAEHMQRVAAAGRLRVSVARACALYHSAAVGIVMSLIATAPEKRDLALLEIVRDHALAAITTDAPATTASRIPNAATQLLALLSQAGDGRSRLSAGEHLLLSEWLLRLAG